MNCGLCGETVDMELEGSFWVHDTTGQVRHSECGREIAKEDDRWEFIEAYPGEE